MGDFLAGAKAVRSAASMAVAFFRIRRAYEVARLSVSDGKVGTRAGVVDHYGLGQLSRLLQVQCWGRGISYSHSGRKDVAAIAD